MNSEHRTDRIDGECLFIAVEHLHDRLRAALAPGCDLTLDLSGIGAADISFVQLLVSASLTAQRAGQSLKLAEPSPALCAALQRSGVAFDPAVGRISPN